MGWYFHFYTIDSKVVGRLLAAEHASWQDVWWFDEGIVGFVFGQPTVIGDSQPVSVQSIPVYRLVSPQLGRHLWTTSVEERDRLVSSGEYEYEFIACFVMPERFNVAEVAATPIYRLYSSVNRNHFLTSSISEGADALFDHGERKYSYEFIAWYALNQQVAGTVPLHRLANTQTGEHFYTTAEDERETLINSGRYRYEGQLCFVFPDEGTVEATTAETTVPLIQVTRVRDMLYTIDVAEAFAAVQGLYENAVKVICHVLPSQVPGSVPFYRLFNPEGGHFYTTDAKERDRVSARWPYEGVTGYVYPYEVGNPAKAILWRLRAEEPHDDPRPVVTSPMQPPVPAPPQGVSRIQFQNCHVDRRRVQIWTRDLTIYGQWQNRRTLDHQFDASGNCPANEPFEISLDDEHQYWIVVTDPDNPLCHDAAPEGDCQRWTYTFVGDSSGPAYPLTIS